MRTAVTNTPRPVSNPLGWGLKRKLIVSMLLVGVVPLLLGLGMAFLRGSKEIQVVSGESFQALATEAARKLDLLVAEEVARTSRIAVHPGIIQQLEHHRDLLGGERRDRQPRLAQRLDEVGQRGLPPAQAPRSPRSSSRSRSCGGRSRSSTPSPSAAPGASGN